MAKRKSTSKSPEQLKRLLVKFFDKDLGSKKFDEALKTAHKTNVALAEAVIVVSEGKLKREKEITKKINRKKKKGSPFAQGGSPGAGKRS